MSLATSTNPNYGATENGPNERTSISAEKQKPTFTSKIRTAKEESTGCCNFSVTLFFMILGSAVWSFVLIVSLIVPVVMVVMGVEYINDCPYRRFIPITLIVGGSTLILSNMINIGDRLHRLADTTMPTRSSKIGWITTFLNLVALGWFISGCVWIYGSYLPSFTKGESNYCNQNLYLFSFWLFNVVFIFMGFTAIVSFIGICCALIWI